MKRIFRHSSGPRPGVGIFIAPGRDLQLASATLWRSSSKLVSTRCKPPIRPARRAPAAWREVRALALMCCRTELGVPKEPQPDVIRNWLAAPFLYRTASRDPVLMTDSISTTSTQPEATSPVTVEATKPWWPLPACVAWTLTRDPSAVDDLCRSLSAVDKIDKGASLLRCSGLLEAAVGRELANNEGSGRKGTRCA
jgi:hypothetical protein